MPIPIPDRPTTPVPEELHADLVVCGAGLAGLCAAVAAARHGAQVILVGERPVLGGCSSSEIRVSPQGSAHFHAYARESGILAELIITDRLLNHAETGGTGWTNSVWDLVLYDLVQRTPGLTLLLNTTVLSVEMDEGAPAPRSVPHPGAAPGLGRAQPGAPDARWRSRTDSVEEAEPGPSGHPGRSGTSRIAAVRARTLGAEREWQLTAPLFVDATGDGAVAAMAGNEWRMGAEAHEEFGEPHAPQQASDGVQGTSIQIMTRDLGHPVPFTAPEWAESYDDDRFFHEGGRIPDSTRSGWWWLELGLPWDTIRDNETIRHELTRRTLGVWDWIKNRSPEYRERFATFALDWMGQVPGKRESRRIVGRHLLTEHDLTGQRVAVDPAPGGMGAEGGARTVGGTDSGDVGFAFPDEVASGGWNIDLHTTGGLLAPVSEPTAAEGYRVGGGASVAAHVAPFGIPLRSLIARDVANLFLAGRDLSATHVALGSVRVQGTTAMMGQAVGTAAALLLREIRPSTPARSAHPEPRSTPIVDEGGAGRIPSELAPAFVHDLQQTLLRDGVFLPHVRNDDPADLARLASWVTVSSSSMNEGMGPGERSADVDYIGAAEFASGTGGEGARGSRGADGRDELTLGRSQWIAVETGPDAPGVASVRLWLRNDTGVPAAVGVSLEPVAGIWDYDVLPERALRGATLTVPAGGPQWISWDVAIDGGELVACGNGRATGYLRLNAEAVPGVSWMRADGVLPGCLAGVAVTPLRLQRLDHGVTLCHRVSPAQRVWGAGQVVSGIARPADATNQWRSAPTLRADSPAGPAASTGPDKPDEGARSCSLADMVWDPGSTGTPTDQWLCLEWDHPVIVGQVVLTWCGHLLRDYDQLPAMRPDPETARDYVVQVWRSGTVDAGGTWFDVATVTGNAFTHRVHTLAEPTPTTRVRVLVNRTNGAGYASLYEVRVYRAPR